MSGPGGDLVKLRLLRLVKPGYQPARRVILRRWKRGGLVAMLLMEHGAACTARPYDGATGQLGPVWQLADLVRETLAAAYDDFGAAQLLRDLAAMCGRRALMLYDVASLTTTPAVQL